MRAHFPEAMQHLGHLDIRRNPEVQLGGAGGGWALGKCCGHGPSVFGESKVVEVVPPFTYFQAHSHCFSPIGTSTPPPVAGPELSQSLVLSPQLSFAASSTAPETAETALAFCVARAQGLVADPLSAQG